MEQRYADVITSLRASYDDGAERRDRTAKEPWKLAERQVFLDRLRAAGCATLLEIGAGTGQDAAFFAANGLEITATDLSPEMVARCRAKGIRAQVMDFLGLDFPDGSVDAVHAMNCLLHVPDSDLPSVLTTVARLLHAGGLFFVGVYGGWDEEGVWDGDSHTPPRFFSRRSDQRLQEFARHSFEIVDFHTRGTGQERFQSLTLRRPADSMTTSRGSSSPAGPTIRPCLGSWPRRWSRSSPRTPGVRSRSIGCLAYSFPSRAVRRPHVHDHETSDPL